MNRRQKKKAFKKKYGYNPPTCRSVSRGLMDGVTAAIKPVFEAFRSLAEEVLRTVKEITEQIQTMPEEDFIKFLETPGMGENTKALARQLRVANLVERIPEENAL